MHLTRPAAPTQRSFVLSLCGHVITSFRGGYHPREATDATRVSYVLCAGSVGPQAVVLGAVREEQRGVVGRQHGGAQVPPRVPQVAHQVEQVAAPVIDFYIVKGSLFWTRLRLHKGLKYFLKIKFDGNEIKYLGKYLTTSVVTCYKWFVLHCK